ncbi:UNVERIFIED_CONTAM: hypothetical protein FKN15_028100 [Acipenser sinensis]
MPKLCRNCGELGHIAVACKTVKCKNCGGPHISSMCTEEKKCNLCGKEGHVFKACPDLYSNMVKGLRVLEQTVEEKEADLESQRNSMAQIGNTEESLEEYFSESDSSAEELEYEEESAIADREVRRMTKHKPDQQDEGSDKTKRKSARHRQVKSASRKVRDVDGVWNGARQWLIQLHEDTNGINGVRRLPSNITMGSACGFVMYYSMPKLCHNSGELGHIAVACKTVKCKNCGGPHINSMCTEEKKFNMCGKEGHVFKACPDLYSNMVKGLRVLEQTVEEKEADLESQRNSMAQIGNTEESLEEYFSESDSSAEELEYEEESAIADREVRRMTKHKPDQQDEGSDKTKRKSARHRQVKSASRKVRDVDGVWNGARQWLIQLHEDTNGINGVRRLPSNITMGSACGFVMYYSMPKLCHNSGELGHIAVACKTVKCKNCGGPHINSMCTEEKKFNMCGKEGHVFKACPDLYSNMVKGLRVLEQTVEEKEADLESQRNSMAQIGNTEESLEEYFSESDSSAEELEYEEESAIADREVRRMTKHKPDQQDEGSDKTKRKSARYWFRMKQNLK